MFVMVYTCVTVSGIGINSRVVARYNEGVNFWEGVTLELVIFVGVPVGGTTCYDARMNDDAIVIDIADTLAKVRKLHTPRADSPGARRVKCRLCSRTFTRGKTQRQYICPTCSRSRQVGLGLQMKAKEGPLYEKTVRGQLRFWMAEAERLGISPDDDAA